MLNQYETVFILTPVLSDVQMKEAVDKFKAVITDNGGTITNEENWGMRKLAYPIQKKSTGFYTLLQFDADPTVIATLETQFRRDERVLRFLSFRLDKYAYEYAEKRKHTKAQPKAEKEVKPATAEVKEETKEQQEN
jgi:small subunit ribosomal protein S6